MTISIDPVLITPINTANRLIFKCENCKTEGVINIHPFCNVNEDLTPRENYILKNYDCPNC